MDMSTTGPSKSRLERMHQVLSGYVERDEMTGPVALAGLPERNVELAADYSRQMGLTMTGFANPFDTPCRQGTQ